MDEQQNDLIPQEPEKSSGPDTGRFYLIRILIGGYIAYLGGQLINSFIRGTAEVHPAFILIAGIVLLLAGMAVAVWSVWLLVRGK